MELTSSNGNSTLSLRDQPDHRQWIAGRIYTLLSHYWREDDPDALTTAIASDWVEVLAGMPQRAIQNACVQYLRDEPRRKPTPGAILQMARASAPPPRLVVTQPAPQPPKPERISAQRAAEIMNEVGFRPKGFGGPADD